MEIKIVRCKDCKFWGAGYTNQKNKFNTTKTCDELQTSGLIDIEVYAGWNGGGVSHIDTEPEFFCPRGEIETPQ